MESNQSELWPDPKQFWCKSCMKHAEYDCAIGSRAQVDTPIYFVAICKYCGDQMIKPEQLRNKLRVIKKVAVIISVLFPTAVIIYTWDLLIQFMPNMLWLLALAIPINLLVTRRLTRRQQDTLRAFDAWSIQQMSARDS